MDRERMILDLKREFKIADELEAFSRKLLLSHYLVRPDGQRNYFSSKPALGSLDVSRVQDFVLIKYEPSKEVILSWEMPSIPVDYPILIASIDMNGWTFHPEWYQRGLDPKNVHAYRDGNSPLPSALKFDTLSLKDTLHLRLGRIRQVRQTPEMLFSASTPKKAILDV